MARSSNGKQAALREQIAHLAARIMAEDGVDDFAYAKRKAARQAGAADARAMPDNVEIERALAAYREIYQKDEHGDILRQLREQALTVMRGLAQFNPHLVGSVLTGVAGRHSDIEIQLFADSAKEVEIFLLNEGVRFRTSQVRRFVNQNEEPIPVFVFDDAGFAVSLTVFDERDIRHSIRATPLGRPLQRAGIAALEGMLSNVSPD